MRKIDLSKLDNVPVVVGLVAIIGLMVLPIPPFLLDSLLAVNITLSVLILLTSVYVMRQLEFSGLPAVLLVATLFRLGLNVASTRLILLGASEGSADVGHIIQTFGRFVVGGNTVVGIIVFLVLVVINFMVITKGAGRIAEVAARFTLDALPGKQMAIDAELAAGALTEEQARERRKEVQMEADFYGAMDGASKFVRGDAIAGLVIVGINILGGLIVGATYGKLSVGEAFHTYTLLTVGDGLVSQIPALLISTATGIVVTRIANDSNLGREVGQQILGDHRVLFSGAAIVFVLGLIPGMPFFIFAVMAAAMGALAYHLSKVQDLPSSVAHTVETTREEEPEELVLKRLLKVEPVSLEIGFGLVGLVDEANGSTLVQRFVQMRRQFAESVGVVVPPIHIRDNLELAPGEYRLLLRGLPIARGELVAGRLLAIDPGGVIEEVDGIATKDPTFGLDALWIDGSQQHRAEAYGYTVVNPETVVITHVNELLRQNAHELFDWPQLQERLELVREESAKLVDDVVDNFGMSAIMAILRRLLQEEISIRDVRSILEALAAFKGDPSQTTPILEHVRSQLSRAISHRFMDQEGVIHAALLDRTLEDALRRCLVQQQGEPVLACDLNTAQALFSEIERAFAHFAAHDAEPLVLAPPDLRAPLKTFLAQFFPNVDVVCHREVVPSAQIISVAQLSLQDSMLAAAE